MVCFCFNSLAMFSLWSTSRSSLRVGQDEFEEFEEPDWAWSSVDGTFFCFGSCQTGRHGRRMKYMLPVMLGYASYLKLCAVLQLYY